MTAFLSELLFLEHQLEQIKAVWYKNIINKSKKRLQLNKQQVNGASLYDLLLSNAVMNKQRNFKLSGQKEMNADSLRIFLHR